MIELLTTGCCCCVDVVVLGPLLTDPVCMKNPPPGAERDVGERTGAGRMRTTLEGGGLLGELSCSGAGIGFDGDWAPLLLACRITVVDRGCSTGVDPGVTLGDMTCSGREPDEPLDEIFTSMAGCDCCTVAISQQLLHADPEMLLPLLLHCC